MRVLFSSTRGAGHVQPLLPYARALLARQHQVLVAAPEEVGSTLREAGIAHAAFDHPGEVLLGPIWARLANASEEEARLIAAREIFAGVNAAVALPKLQATIGAFRPDVVVRDSVEFAAVVAAEAAGVPHARVAAHSVSFEDAIPAAVAEPLDALRTLNGLAPDGGACLRAEPIFSSFPASLDVVPADSTQRSPFRARVVEEKASSEQGAWTPAADPRPLVYVTFGSLAGNIARVRWIYRTSLDALAALPLRALLTTGRDLDLDALGTIPANVQVERWIPQREVLPHVAAVVCHGGSGTLLGSLAAGLPLVVVPFGADQPHNGRLVAAAGAGIVLGKPDASELGSAIRDVLANPELRRQARRLASDISAMPTIDDAVDTLLAAL